MHSYYHITGGLLFEPLLKFQADYRAALDARIQFASGVGAEACKGSTLWRFPQDPGKGWKRPSSQKEPGIYTPDGRIREGKVLQAQIRKLPDLPGSMQLLHLLLEHSPGKNFMKVNALGWPGLRVREAAIYLTCDEYWLPEDRTGIKELTLTEFNHATEEAHAHPDPENPAA